MIKNIKAIRNLGKYEKINDTLEFSKNNLIFGFNGMGKSTLSDIFYSMANPNNEELLRERKTLPHEKLDVEDVEQNNNVDNTGVSKDTNDIEVIINTDDGDITFSAA